MADVEIKVELLPPPQISVELTAEGPAGSGSGSDTFIDLTDTPSSYAGQANKMLAVKADETGIDYISAGSGMGDMMKSIYDTNDNGIVDKAEEAEAIDGGTF